MADPEHPTAHTESRRPRFAALGLVNLGLLLALCFAVGRVLYYLPPLLEQLMRLSAGAWG